jgi:hypothetical protein
VRKQKAVRKQRASLVLSACAPWRLSGTGRGLSGTFWHALCVQLRMLILLFVSRASSRHVAVILIPLRLRHARNAVAPRRLQHTHIYIIYDSICYIHTLHYINLHLHLHVHLHLHLHLHVHLHLHLHVHLHLHLHVHVHVHLHLQYTFTFTFTLKFTFTYIHT